MSFNIAASIFAGTAVVAFAVWLTQYKPQEKIKAWIIREDDTFDGVLKFPGDKIKLCATIPDNKLITWEYDDYSDKGVKIEEDETDNSVTVSVDSSAMIMEQFDVIVIAKDGTEEVDRIVLPVGSIEQAPVPTTDTSIFNFSKTVEPNDTITGFSEQVIADPTKLWVYSSLDFSNQNSVKFIDKDCVFNCETGIPGKKIFDVWKPLEINFGNLTFLPNEEGMTGYHLFYEADLNSLITLDFNHSNWAPAESSYSAECVFEGANLSGVVDLNLKDTVFASDKMVTNERDDYPLGPALWTASGTFMASDLSSLVTLDLSDAEFAVDGMNISEGEISTAESTFGGCKFDSLEELKLENTVFASKEMGGSYICTALNTFKVSSFPKLTSLDLNRAKFVDKDMKGKKICTANSTFCDCEFVLLEELNLENVTFAAKEMTISGEVYSGEYTFSMSNFYSLKELNLKNMVFADKDMNSEGEVATGHFTFSFASFPNLEKLDLSEAILFTTDMDENSEVASYMFYDATFSESFHDLYLPKEYGGKNGEWKGTFGNGNSVDYSSLFVHGYKEQPEWFVNSSLTDAIWVNNIPITEDFFSLAPSEDDENLYVVSGFSGDVISTPTKLDPYNVLDFTDNPEVKFVSGTCNFGFWESIGVGFRDFWEGLYKLSFEGLHFLTTYEGYSGAFMFQNYVFTSLVKLNLSKTKWADKNTKYSAFGTFAFSKFPQLKELNLSNAEFATEGMGMNLNSVEIACETFLMCKFNVLEKLILENTVFAAKRMKSKKIQTASRTFNSCTFSLLEKLNLENAVFAVDEMMDLDNTEECDLEIAMNTFQNTTFGNNFSVIILPIYNVALGDWTDTFSPQSKEKIISIYGYNPCPGWFNDNWWPNAQWIAEYPTI